MCGTVSHRVDTDFAISKEKRVRKSNVQMMEFLKERQVRGGLSGSDLEIFAERYGLTRNQVYKWNWDISKKEKSLIDGT